MTAIIILGENVEIEGAYDATNDLVNYHVGVTQSRFQNQVVERLETMDSVDLGKMPLPHDIKAYKATIRGLNEKHDVWSVRDDRAVFFLDQLPGIIGDVRVIWSSIEQNPDDYGKLLQKRIKPVYDGFGGPKMTIQKASDTKQIAGFIKGNKPKATATNDSKRLSN